MCACARVARAGEISAPEAPTFHQGFQQVRDLRKSGCFRRSSRVSFDKRCSNTTWVYSNATTAAGNSPRPNVSAGNTALTAVRNAPNATSPTSDPASGHRATPSTNLRSGAAAGTRTAAPRSTAAIRSGARRRASRPYVDDAAFRRQHSVAAEQQGFCGRRRGAPRVFGSGPSCADVSDTHEGPPAPEALTPACPAPGKGRPSPGKNVCTGLDETCGPRSPPACGHRAVPGQRHRHQRGHGHRAVAAVPSERAGITYRPSAGALHRSVELRLIRV
jgi:hypothetical protein